MDEFNILIDSTGGQWVNLRDTDWGIQLSDIVSSHIGNEDGTIDKKRNGRCIIIDFKRSHK